MLDDEKRRRFDLVVWIIGILFAALLLVDAAVAGGREALVDDATYRDERDTCAIAYPPPLRSASSWKTLMPRPDSHFGTDASPDAKAQAEVSALPDSEAVAEGRFDTSAVRISETPCFRKEHDEIAVVTWKNPAAKGAANLGTCDAQAERGDLGEHGSRVPR